MLKNVVNFGVDMVVNIGLCVAGGTVTHRLLEAVPGGKVTKACVRIAAGITTAVISETVAKKANESINRGIDMVWKEK